MKIARHDDFKGTDVILISGDADELCALAEFLARWSESPTDGSLSAFVNLSDLKDIDIKIVNCEGLGSGGINAANCPVGLYVWAVTRRQAIEFSGVVGGVARSNGPSHAYLEGPCDDIVILISKDEY